MNMHSCDSAAKGHLASRHHWPLLEMDYSCLAMRIRATIDPVILWIIY